LPNSEKVVLVSGSTKGIGKAIVKRFIEDGYLVIQNSRNKIDKSDLVATKHIQFDVTNYQECLKLIETVQKEFGRLDILICNVGSGAELENKVSSEKRWDHFIDINLLSAAYLVDAAISMLLKSRGNVVAISSICGSYQVNGAPVEYSVSKAALNMFIKSMALKYGKSGVRFNAVSPGNVMFNGSTWHTKLKNNEVEVNKFIIDNVPMGVFVESEDVAEAVLFLASNKSRFTTGAIINVDGGQSL
jgi:3-oxoacyl-[acyl-carrier protein] reductase